MFQEALSTEQQRWLKRTFIITDPILRSQVEHAETMASEAKAAASDAPPATEAEVKAAAQLLAAAAEAMRATVPEEHRAYGTTGRGAAVAMTPTSKTSSSRRSGSCAATQSRATSAP